MSISVYIAHTGQRLQLDPSVTSSLDQVRSWIATNAYIPPRAQILLTSAGKQVRTQTLLTENEIFVFDSSVLNGKKASSPSKEESAESSSNSTATTTTSDSNSGSTDDFHPGAAPDTIANQVDLQSWQNLFRLRKSWAATLLNGCSARAKQAEQYQDEQAAIERSVGVAVASLQQHIKSAEKQVATGESWINDVLHEQQTHVDNWEHNLGSLRNLPARPEFTRFIQPMAPASGSSRRLSQQHISTLQGFVDVVAVKQAAAGAKSLMTNLAQKVDSIRRDLDSASTNANELLQAVEQISNRALAESASEPAQLIEEIRMVVNKMASDYEHVQSLPKTPPNVSSVSKMALLHTRSYVPNLVDYCVEMNEMAHRTKQQRESVADRALEHMRTLSAIESQLAKLYQDVKELEVPEDQHQAFMSLSIISRLPSVYGQLLVESVRRREWVAKMKRDCGTLQEEVAAYQDEEEKRRKKWMRNVDDIVSPEALQSRVLGLELSLQNEGGSWPMTTRDELSSYLATLIDVYGQGPVTDEIEQAIKDLDKPTRKQIKHARAFKNGSMHEAAFGDTSLLLRGDEQYKSLREANVRLEEEVKGQKSRVRKLEDLLHRQTQMSRASTGDIFTPASDSGPLSRIAMPPVGQVEDTSRHSSTDKRRPSIALGLEEKRLAKRVVDLEAELQSYKDDLTSRKTSDAEIQKQFEEATSTKKDLMENMEAQQREFAVERRHLEKELREAREKIEECENEIERVVGSRDGVDDEISRLKEDAAGHAARAATEHDARNVLERRLEIAEAAKVQAEQEVQRMRMDQERVREADAEQLQFLITAHSHLSSPDAPSPDGLVALSSALEELARRSAAHAKDLAEAVAFAKSENESLWSSNERQKTELANAAQRQTESEEQVRSAEEKLAAAAAKTRSLEEQLGDEQEQLRMLRSKFAEGETGSEVLRQRVTEAESRARAVTSELAEAKSHVNTLDVELMRLQKKHKIYHSNAETASERLDKRAERAKEVSQRLYSQNMRLGRLLERLGLVITYQGDTMSIERASKMAASTSIIDPHAQLSRQVTISSPSPTRKPSAADMEPATDLKLLHWPDAPSVEGEASQYDAFLAHISRFDLDVFADAVTKRVKDFEYTAKKYSKEAKESNKRADAYKERALKLRSEGHAKIAVRDFKEGDLALFLPTRGGQVKGAWAAFNIGCPHYFLAEREGMRLGTRDFIVARIQKVEQKVVDLSGQSKASQHSVDGRSIDGTSDAFSSMHVEDDNPFDLSDGLTWWMVHASEERVAGAAPTTPGLGKSTVAAANVDAKGSIRVKRNSHTGDASKHLNKSLDSRRSSSTSKKGVTGGATPTNPTAPTTEASRQRSGSQASSLGLQQQQLQHRSGPAPTNSGLGIFSQPSHHNTDTAAMQRPASQDQSTSQQQQQQEQVRMSDSLSLSANPSHQHHRPLIYYAQSEPHQRQHPRATSPLSPSSAAPLLLTRAGSSSPTRRPRTTSPSKSGRSLLRAQDNAPLPSRSPSRSQPQLKPNASVAKRNGWESLFSAEFSLESPTKEH